MLLPLPVLTVTAWPRGRISLSRAVLEWGYLLALIHAYRSGDFGQVYPIARGLSPMLVFVRALVFAGEVLKPLAAPGIALVSCGIVSLAFRR
ncbi:multidrug transporter EmrE-like cation transporter [Paraburkholderia sp. MM5482-R2]